MKNLNLIKRLWTDSHEKQSPQRFARYAAILIMLLTIGVGQMWGAAKQRYIYVGLTNDYHTYKDASTWGINFLGGTSAGVKQADYINQTYNDGSRDYYIYRFYVYDNHNQAEFKGNDSWWKSKSSVTLNGTTNNAIFFSASADGWEGCFQGNYQVSSSASLAASSTSVAIGTNVTLTPSLSTNATYNEIKSTSYSVTTNPGGGGSVTSAGVFSATKAGSYMVTATVTYNAKDFSGITKTATATRTITVYATVTFDKEGGSGGNDTQNATYNTATSSITAPTKTNYDFGGYYDGDNGTGNQIINASGVWQKSKSGFTDNSTTPKWIILTNVTLYAKWTPKSYSITYKDQGNVTYSGSNSGSLPSSYTYGTGIASLTDGVKSGYRFDGWFDNSDCTGSAVTSISTTATGAKTFYAKWTENPGGTVTLTAGTGGEVSKDNSSWGTSKSYTGIKTTDALNIYARANAGYTFSAWSKTSGSGTISSTSSASTTFTPVANADAALTASFTENKVTLTPTVSYDHGSSTYTASSSNMVGVTTTTNLSCSAPTAAHYTFAGWTLTNLTVTSGNAATDRSIAVKITTPGSPIAAVANYNENLNTTWYICGASGGTSPFSGWGTGGTRMYKKSGYSTVEKYYCTIIVASVADASGFGFKAYKSDEFDDAHRYFAYSDQNYTIDNNSQIIYNNNGANDMHFKAYVTGDYEFEIDKTGANPVLTIHWPIYNQVRISAASPTDATNTGNFDLSDPVSNVRTVTRSLKANTTYTFKIMYNSDWYGYNSGTFTRNSSTSSNSRTLSTSGGNLTLTTDYAGDYTFRFNQSTKDLSVDFPTAYKVTYGKGTVNGSTGSCSAKDIDNGNAAVTSNSTWVKKDHRVVLTAPAAKTGYTYDGWFDNNSGTGAAITTNANCTITVSSALTRYACYHENSTAVTITTDGHGTITTPNPNESPYSLGVATMQDINASANTGYHWNTWTVSGTAALNSSAATQSNKAKGDGTAGGSGTVTATFSPNTYSVTFDANGGTGDAMSAQVFTYDVAQALSANTYTRTGYDFDGWATEAEGTKFYNPGQSVSNLTTANGGTFPLFAHWTAKSYTVTLDIDEANHGTIDGKATSASVTFDAAPTAIAAGQLPTAAQGYAFMGFFTAAGGEGVQVINGDGTWIASVTGYTDGSGNWVRDDDVPLYAYYKKAEITTLALSAGTVLPKGSVTATPTIEPTPTGTHKICWKLLYNNGTEYSPQPTFTPESGNVVSFNAPEASGTYKVRAQLRTGSECGAGTLLSEQVASFVVAGTHTVTIQYKCGDVTVKSSTVVEGVKPLEWSEEITPDEIFGYSFEKWVAGDGVTMTINGGVTTIETGGETTGKATTHAVQIKAIYDGKLIAKYTKKNIIYFKNTLGWSDVYAHFLGSSYWDTSNGTGNNGRTDRNKQMTRLGETDIWYFDYGAADITPNDYLVFTDRSYNNWSAFNEPDISTKPAAPVVYPIIRDNTEKNGQGYGFNAGTPMFVPVTQDGIKKCDNKAIYYNNGYWRAYDPTTGESGSTGYTLKIYNKTEDSSRELLQSIPFTNADASGQIFKATINMEAAKEYGIMIERDNSMMYTNIDGRLNRTGDVVTMAKGESNYKAIYILTTAAGDYDFIITCNGSGQLCLQATFPAAKNDYRVLYTDNATWSNGAHTLESWVHPSRVISAKAGATDTISFFISKDNSPKYKIQKVNAINESTGAITWTNVTSWTDISVGKTGVYNFIFNQPSAGSISLSKTEAYTGNYYIRTDNAGSTKWENYRAEDHKMTYSEYAAKITHTGEDWKDFTHYFMKYVDKDKESGKYKNVKFTVANDYSPCISDTLVRQAGDVTPNNVDAYGNLQASANIRFMWNSKNNKLQRAYLAAAQSDGTKFLVLQGQSGKLLAPDGTALSDENGNNHRGGTDAIQFTDKEHWMYEAEVKAVPGGRVKLYATYNSSTFYYYGDNTASFSGASAIDLVTGNGGEAQTIRVVYDFKTDRLMAAWVPSEETIENETKTVNADIMLIREHQGQGHQINLKGTGSIKTNKTVYGVLRFNRWTLNNKSTTNTGTTENPVHAVLPVGEQKSQYERFNYMISFPFDVKVGEIFGFGTIGRHYRIYYYDGLGRAKEGFFAERGDDNWRMIDDTDSILHANQGYLLQLNYIRMADDNTATWPQKNMNEVELYFPAMNEINTISLADVTIPALGDAYNCKINLKPTYEAQGNPNAAEADRRVKDSYWRCIGVPGFTSYAANDTWENFNWNADTENMPYLYEWHMDDNKLSVVSSSTFTFKPMHAYLIQNGNSFTWSSVAVPSKTSIVARRQAPASEDGYYEFYLEMSKDEEPQDHTYVRLTDNENVTADFDFGQDLSKELNSGANIFTKVGYERLAANNLPLSEQTTIVPVGVKIAAEGNYTFAMPEGTHGIGVTLVDNETGDRTNLSLFDYSVNLTKGDYANRFILEISPVKQMPTDIENVQGDNVQGAKARKVMVDGILYIVKDGKVFDARGAKVK